MLKAGPKQLVRELMSAMRRLQSWIPKKGTHHHDRSDEGVRQGSSTRPIPRPEFYARKHRKLQRIRQLLAREVEYVDDGRCIDCLTDKMRREYAIVDMTNVSAHQYDAHALGIINDNKDGLILTVAQDCTPFTTITL